MRGNHLEKFCWTKKRIVSAILSAALFLACIGFSTYAWLTSKDTPVVNEFIGSELEITLTPETDQGPFQLIPGMTYHLTENQIPKVKVIEDSVECYLFAVLVEDWGFNSTDTSKNKPNYYFKIGGINSTNWAFLNNGDYKKYGDTSRYRVMYCKVNDKNYVEVEQQGVPFKVFESLYIPSERTKQEVHPNVFASGQVPKVTVKAYSIQTVGLKKNGGTVQDVADAWALVEKAMLEGNTKEVVLN